MSYRDGPDGPRNIILKWLFDHEDELSDGYHLYLPVVVESDWTSSKFTRPQAVPLADLRSAQINEARERSLVEIADDLLVRLRQGP